MNEFIYVIKPTRLGMLTEGPTPEEEKIIGEHFEYLKRLHEKGVVHMAGRTLTADEASFGIVILKAENVEMAANIMNNDPAVQKSVMNAELFPYRIALG